MSKGGMKWPWITVNIKAFPAPLISYVLLADNFFVFSTHFSCLGLI